MSPRKHIPSLMQSLSAYALVLCTLAPVLLSALPEVNASAPLTRRTSPVPSHSNPLAQQQQQFQERCFPLHAPSIVSQYRANLRVAFTGIDPLHLSHAVISFNTSAVAFTLDTLHTVSRLDMERTFYMLPSGVASPTAQSVTSSPPSPSSSSSSSFSLASSSLSFFSRFLSEGAEEGRCSAKPLSPMVGVLLGAHSFVTNQTTGLAYNSTQIIDGVQCDVWASYISEHREREQDWDGLYVCVRPSTTRGGDWIPVRAWQLLDSLIYQIDYDSVTPLTNEETADALKVPDACAQGLSRSMPIGLRDDFAQHNEYWWSLLIGTPSHFEFGTPWPQEDAHAPRPAQITSGASGRTTLHIVLKPGDGSQNGGDGHGSERDEMISVPMRTNVDGQTQMFYSWQFMMPDTFPRDGNRLVIGQWKQSPLSQQSPIIAQRYNSSTEQIYWTVRNVSSHCNNQSDHTVVASLTLKRGIFHRVSIGIKWTAVDVQDAVVVFFDGTQVGSYDGRVLVPGESSVINLLGMYRNAVPTTYDMYFANYEITTTPVLT
eukprot:TRINITY_DN6007_c0_g1_i1.p1 TRINITY_DN6007_c0_g1~~TRINITY_DN6007_c0_g1_i1.p1  ORF type:complete len:543 (+),score=105.77 TRINITY_DN6007_c0_g1_i1:114-1742(+)